VVKLNPFVILEAVDADRFSVSTASKSFRSFDKRNFSSPAKIEIIAECFIDLYSLEVKDAFAKAASSLYVYGTSFIAALVLQTKSYAFLTPDLFISLISWCRNSHLNRYEDDT